MERTALREEYRYNEALINSSSRLYPCSDCAEDMRADLVKSPPRVTSSEEFSLWLCQLHNKVNLKLGKEIRTLNRFSSERSHLLQASRSLTAARSSRGGETAGLTDPVTELGLIPGGLLLVV